MKIMVVGKGGREEVLTRKLAQSTLVTGLLVAPGSDAMEEIRLISSGEPVRRLPFEVTDAKAIADFARDEKYDLVIPGPEACLEAELGDYCRQYSIPFSGPDSRGARLETSKAFQFQFLVDNDIPRPIGKICETVRSAQGFATFLNGRCAVKADGIAFGKGVLLGRNFEETFDAINRLMIKRECGRAGDRVVIQSLEQGEEVSLHYITDAKSVLALETARDYKRVGVGDTGENTGGMGGYSPGAPLDEKRIAFIQRSIIERWRRGCDAEKILYRGILYPGIILTPNGPKVLEFNARWGDPEAELLLRRFTGDLAKLLYASATDSLDSSMLSWTPDTAVCIVLCSRGYPETPDVGFEITGLTEALKISGVEIFHMGTKRCGDQWFTNGGRVLAITALRTSRQDAREACLEVARIISFEGKHYRDDIAA